MKLLWIDSIIRIMLIYFFALERITPPLNQYSELERMLALRRLNWSYTELSDEFKVKKMTIRYLVRRFGLNGKYKPPIRKGHATSKYDYLLYSEEKLNPGKTYAQYLQADKERKCRELNQ